MNKSGPSPDSQLLPRDLPAPPIWGENAQDSTLDIVVFSKDRACQLDALLRSIREFLHFPHRMYILYTTSSTEFERGYDLLRRWNPGVNWVQDEGQFGQVMRKLMVAIDHGPGRYLMFLVDDMMFTRPFTAQALMESLDDDEDILAVSLRMGENITYCYVRDINTEPPDFSKGYRWAWQSASSGYWNYPMSLDAHIFRVADFAGLLPNLVFMNPNTLEATLSGHAFPRTDMVCEQFPSVINIAVNKVQSTYGNRCGNISAESLNGSFLQGLAIDAAHFAGEVHNSCHIDQDLPLVNDERSRQPPATEIIQKNGRPYYRIDLREIPTFVLNCPKDIKNRIFQQEQLNDLGMNCEFVTGMEVEPGWVGVALGHLKALRLTRARPPFLILEDDCVFTEDFNPVLEIPAEAEALYLGVSSFGLPEPGTISWALDHKTRWQRFDNGYLRVFNMLARHALLYLDEAFCQTVIESQLEALSNRNFPHPGDIGLAQLHASHRILALERSVCRQTNRVVTHIHLPEALPDNEIEPEESFGKRPPEPAKPQLPSPHNKAERRLWGDCQVSHKYRFIFFNMAKNASSSLRTEFKLPRYGSEEISIRDLDQSIEDEYFKFTFLRDPVARTASAYQEISLRRDMNDKAIPEQAFMKMEDSPERFAAFVDAIEAGFGDVHIRAQHKFISGIEIDFYGRVESLQSDLARLYEILGMGSCPVLPRRRSREGRKTDYDYDRFNIDEKSLSATLVDQIRSIYRADIDLIEAYCPLPGLRSSGRQEKKSSQSQALLLSADEGLSPIDWYSRVNQSHQECMVYCLGDRGFFAEISTVARAMLFAWSKGLQLVLDVEGFAWGYQKGWKDYFEPFCLTTAELKTETIVHKVAFTLTGNREPFETLLKYMPESFEFGHTRLEGFQNILGFFMKLIFRPVSDCQALIDELTASLNLPAEYDAIHVRRGDKVGDEDIYYPVDAYLDRLAPLETGRTLFVMSDSWQAVKEVRQAIEKRKAAVRVVTLVEPERTGFDVWKLRRGEQFLGDGGAPDDPQAQRAYVMDQTRRLVAETVIAAHAARFISTWRSNVGRTVWYISNLPENSVLLREHDLKDGQETIESGMAAYSLTGLIQDRQHGLVNQNPRLTLFRCLNEAITDCMVFRLSSRPLMEQLIGISRAMIYARVNELQLVLDVEDFKTQEGFTWHELFEPFCLTADQVNPLKIRQRFSCDDTLSMQKLQALQPSKFSFGQDEIQDFTQILGYFMNLTLGLTPQARGAVSRLLSPLDLQEDFDLLYIHRGDEGVAQGAGLRGRGYLKPLGSIPDGRLLVLMTDDHAVENDVRSFLRSEGINARLVTFEQSSQPVESTVFQLAALNLALNSRYFVAGRKSTLGLCAWSMHPNRQWCHLLDAINLNWLKPGHVSNDVTTFMAEVHLGNGHLHRLELAAASPLLRELRRAAMRRGGLLKPEPPGSGPPGLIQLPLKGGEQALAFSGYDLACLRLVPDSGYIELKLSPFAVTGGGIAARKEKKAPPVKQAEKESCTPADDEHPAMNIDEGHLGGYIRSRHPESAAYGAQHGDSETWEPGLWEWIIDELKVESVLDLGCGEGHAAAWFRDAGCRVLGIDGSIQAQRDSVIPEDHMRHDYVSGPCIPEEIFDMVWCCEFVEHVEERFTHNFLATLASARKYVFLTYAPPGQPGWHHVNCQHRDYWINKVERLGFRYEKELSARARENASGHYSRKGMVFVRDQDSAGPDSPDSDTGASARQLAGTSGQPLPVNDMEVAVIDGNSFYLFLDIFVHPSRTKIVAVLPYYFEDWDPAEHGIEVENVMLEAGDISVRGQYIPHRLDSWEPCALMDFEGLDLAALIQKEDRLEVTIKVGKHNRKFTLSTVPQPAYRVLMSLVVKNENRWIRHFLEYYLECLQVDHVLVYDNGTSEQAALREILAPYQAAGKVTVIPWNYRWRNIKAPRKMIAQPQQEAHSLNRFANSRWIGFLDVDELLRLPGKTLPGFLADFEKVNVDGLSFGLRWFSYSGVLDFEEIIDPPLTFLEAERDDLGRKRQKLLVSPRRARFLRLHTLQEGGRELQVDDTDIYFHHYCQRPHRFDKGPFIEDAPRDRSRDEFMLQFAGQLALEGPGHKRPKKPETKEQWIKHITSAIAEAESGRSRLDQQALEVNGLCGTMNRHFMNNICNFQSCRYLEIGSFEGATTVAATFNNEVTATCIDNFCQFNAKREEFEANMKRFPPRGPLRLIEQDCFSVDIEELGKFDVYLYDGPHSSRNQYRAIMDFGPALAPMSVVIIDDWNWEYVRESTLSALRDSGLPVLYQKEIILREQGVDGEPDVFCSDSWWNGVCIMLLGQAGSG